MEYVDHETVTIKMSIMEARVMRAVMRNIHESDPFGAACKDLKISVNAVVQVADSFEKILAKAT